NPCVDIEWDTTALAADFQVLSTKPRTCKCLVGPVESQGVALAAAFNAGPLPTGLSGRQRRAIDRTTPFCDKNDARRTGCSEVFRCARVIRTRAAVGGSWPPSRRETDTALHNS